MNEPLFHWGWFALWVSVGRALWYGLYRVIVLVLS